MNKLRTLAQLAILATTAGLVACGTGEAMPVAETADTPPAGIPVEVAVTQSGSIEAIYAGTVTLVAEHEAPVVARVGGEVVEIFVEEGDSVKAGQVLARLDGDRLRLDLRQSRAALDKVRQDYQRNRELHSRGLVAPDAFETLKFDVDALEASFRMASLNLSYTEIRAPIDGVVTSRMIKTGNALEQDTAAFHVTNLSDLEAYLYVPQRELYKFETNQTTRIAVDALPGQTFPAHIKRISPRIDAETGTFKVTIAVDDTYGELKPGMFGRVSVVYDVHENSVTVPKNALIAEDNEAAVFVVEDGLARRKIVAVGISNDGVVEITDGLQTGEQVVVVGNAGLSDGTRVTVHTG